MMNIKENEACKLLAKAILSLESEEECLSFLEDLMTRKELSDISQRLEVAKMLSEQAVYNKIVEKTGASTATISRVNRSLAFGHGGYEVYFARQEEAEKASEEKSGE